MRDNIGTGIELAEFFKKLNDKISLLKYTVEVINLTDRKKVLIEDTAHPILLENGKKYLIVAQNPKGECEIAHIKMY